MLLLATSICGGFVTHTIGPRLTENLSLWYCQGKLIYDRNVLFLLARVAPETPIFLDRIANTTIQQSYRRLSQVTYIVTKPVESIKVLENLYPRSQMDTSAIARYVDSLEELPPIEINQNDVLIDGAHRLSAHKQANIEFVDCIVTETSTDAELFELAIKRNAAHGIQLSQKDKRSIANQLYDGSNKDHLSKILSIPSRTLARWLEGKDKELREKRKEAVFDRYMRCYTQEAIAEELGIPQQTVSDAIKNLTDNCQMAESGKNFKPELYTIWNFSKLGKDHDYPGNLPPAILENLLWKYTKPFDVVFDPFGGEGYSTDICRGWNRRYYVSDINPSEIAKQRGVRQHDITTGLPGDLPVTDLVFLDPPYWTQMKGEYGDEETNLSNMELGEFYSSMLDIFKCVFKKLRGGGVMAFIIQNTQWRTEDKHVEPHSHVLWNLAESVGFEFDQLIQVPYSPQQYTPQQVEKAKEGKLWLVTNRELVIFRK